MFASRDVNGTVPVGEEAMHWRYEIVPAGGWRLLVGGDFDAPSIEAAKHYLETVCEPTVNAEAEFEWRLINGFGQEVWRSPYLGPV